MIFNYLFLIFVSPNLKLAPMTRKSYQFTLSFIVFLFFIIQGKAISPGNCLLFSITSQNSARLGVINTGKRSLDLTITNTTGDTYFIKSVKGETNFFQLLDLANMPDGNYTVKLVDGENTTDRRFTVSNSLAKIIREEEETKPNFHMPDNQTLIVSYFNAHQNSVNIFFMMNDEVVFEDRGLLDMALSKKYSLRELPAGKYEVKLYSGGQIYSYPLILN